MIMLLFVCLMTKDNLITFIKGQSYGTVMLLQPLCNSATQSAASMSTCKINHL